ncbi:MULTISPECIES: HIT family protein [unclassified Aeromicrobium]|uniref:HIT family protein n=1 Tax=unclassified Aeromicrobium TaxID=2633570 RepID=UPI00288BF189|nr:MULTISPECIES: HIT family protein [unclassified Aeromicrobium]
MNIGRACVFCDILEGQPATVLYEDDTTFVISPKDPATNGHLLVIPKGHVGDIWSLETTAAQALAETVLIVSKAVRSAHQPDGLNIIQSNGTAATQSVDHVHIHVLPRYTTDAMDLAWPKSAWGTPAQEEASIQAVRKALGTGTLRTVTGEDRRQHLAFIQAIVTRMAQASAQTKTWLLPIVTAAYGAAVLKSNEWLAVLGIGAVAIFALLDANYLKQEKGFRRLYDKVITGKPIKPFALVPELASSDNKNRDYWPDWEVWRSWAIAPVYGALAGAGLIIVLALQCQTI